VPEIEIRECETLDEFSECVQIQREVFTLPEAELSPVRHLVVTKNAGGFVIGAFDGDRIAGFVLSVPAFLRGERAFYSHMTGVRAEYQSLGIGAKLKWAQRERSLALGVKFIKWTFEPVKARNAFFNLEKLGAIAREYMPNFYGTDYAASAMIGSSVGLPSDRLFAEWHLESPKVMALQSGQEFVSETEPASVIEITGDWQALVREDSRRAIAEQTRLRRDFEIAFGNGLVASGFRRDRDRPAYLLYKV
jgi:predicted GNAT superfamily acetyltransferase